LSRLHERIGISESGQDPPGLATQASTEQVNAR
jgi:hypothetical protein